MRAKIFLMMLLSAMLCVICAGNTAIADEPEEQTFNKNFKLRDYLPHYTPVYVEINRPVAFLKELATWEYLNTVLKLNLKSEEIPVFGDLYNALETVKTISEALSDSQKKSKKHKKNVEIINSLEIAIPQINLMNIQDLDITKDLIMHLKVNEYADVLTQLVLILQTQIEKLEIIKIDQYEGTVVLEINTGESTIFASLMKHGHILVTWKRFTLEKYIDKILENEEEKTLSASETYKTAVQSSINEDTQEEKNLPRVKVYLYLRQLIGFLSMLLGNDQNFADGFNPFNLGIKNIQAICLNMYFEKGKMHEKLGICTPEKRSGIFGFFPTEPCEFNFAKHAPENVSSIYIAQTDMMRVFTHFEELIQILQPELSPYIRNFVNSAETFGYNYIEEALKSMNGEFSWWSLYDPKGKLSEVTYLFESKEEKLCNLLIDELAKNLHTEYFLTVEKAEYNEINYRVFNIEQGLRDTILQLPLELPEQLQDTVQMFLTDKLYDKIFVAFCNNKLIFTSSLERLKSLIDNPEGLENSLAKKRAFKAEIKDLKKSKAASVLYLGDKNFVNSWYDTMQSLFGQIIQETGDINLEMPSKKVFAESFKPFGALSFGGYKNLVEIRSHGMILGTAITLASFAAKSAIKKEIQNQLKEFYNKLQKK